MFRGEAITPTLAEFGRLAAWILGILEQLSGLVEISKQRGRTQLPDADQLRAAKEQIRRFAEQQEDSLSSIDDKSSAYGGGGARRDEPPPSIRPLEAGTSCSSPPPEDVSMEDSLLFLAFRALHFKHRRHFFPDDERVSENMRISQEEFDDAVAAVAALSRRDHEVSTKSLREAAILPYTLAHDVFLLRYCYRVGGWDPHYSIFVQNPSLSANFFASGRTIHQHQRGHQHHYPASHPVE